MLTGTAGRWLRQSITRYAVTGHDGDGLPTHSVTGDTIPCRIDAEEKKLVSMQGDEIISTAQIIISGDYTIDPEDRIVLPDSREPLILRIQENVDPNGDRHHTVIYT